MRDLSKIPLGRTKKKVWLPKRLIRIFILFILVFGVIFLLKSKTNVGGAGGSSVVLKEASRGLTPVELDSSHEELTKNAVDLTTQKAVLDDLMYGGEAKATATRSFGGGSYILSVEATLPDPKNVNYQVWVVGGGEVIPVDFMSGSKTKWSLNIRGKDDYSNYGGIWITLERTKDDLPEEHVMEGKF